MIISLTGRHSHVHVGHEGARRGSAPLGLHTLTIIGQVGQQLVVSFMEQGTCAALQLRVDVSCTGSILASLPECNSCPQ